MMRALMVLLIFGLFATGTARASEWIVQPDKSEIRWTAKWNTSPIHGGFEDFSARIVFDPDNLAQADIAVDVETGSIFMQGQDARSTLTDENWFFAKTYPKAHFQSRDVRHMGNGRYEAHGTLRIKGEEKPVVLPFKLTIEGDIARVEGGVSLDRMGYGLGLAGDIAAAVAPAVDVAIKVTAQRQ